ncbi:MAG TPA: VWA domain-containing protein [Vicinamibacterales bacterium]|nr:VWA domain-containing protein [Vicinamibacterales bacterium]
MPNSERRAADRGRRGQRLGLAAALAAAIVAAPGAAPPQEPSTSQSFSASATAILVDVVVRDSAGRPATSLTAADFEITEDRVPQKIDSFTRVTRGGGIGVGVAWRAPGKTTLVSSPDHSDAAASATDAVDDATTAIVFDHLSTESLRLAQKATLAYVPRSGESSVKVGVFATDPGIRVIQRYTNDRALMRRAVERIAPSGTAVDDRKAERLDELLERRRDLRGENETAIAAASASTGAGLSRSATEIGSRESDLRLIQTELNMIRAFDSLDRDRRGYDAILALSAIIQTLADLPGRKTIVFFSEGLPATPGLSARLDTVIDIANRANVTTYAVDARGLGTRSASSNPQKEINAFTDERLNQLTTGSDRTEQPLTMSFERVEDTMRLDSRTGLARLAAETGGFLVDESNALSSAFKRIDEDNQFHYLLTYSPTNPVFDGKFRSIQVKVRKPGMQVFARKGYRAVRTVRAGDAGDVEAPALALLDRRPLPNAFPVQAASFSFPDPARPGLTPVLVRVATDGLRFVVDEERSTYSGQVTVLVRVRDDQGRDVEKLSQQYLLTGEARDLTAAKRGEILFYREPDLPPGVYTIDSIVFDAMARHGSVRVATLTVPAAPPAGLGMSSLVLIDRLEEVNDPPKPGARGVPPLYVGRTLLYPNLGQPIRRTPTGQLPFYFTLYGSTQDVTVNAQLLHNGRALADAPVQLPHSAAPLVQHIGRLPIGALPAGTYELRIRVSDGRQELSRTAFFTIE